MTQVDMSAKEMAIATQLLLRNKVIGAGRSDASCKAELDEVRRAMKNAGLRAKDSEAESIDKLAKYYAGLSATEKEQRASNIVNSVSALFKSNEAGTAGKGFQQETQEAAQHMIDTGLIARTRLGTITSAIAGAGGSGGYTARGNSGGGSTGGGNGAGGNGNIAGQPKQETPQPLSANVMDDLRRWGISLNGQVNVTPTGQPDPGQVEKDMRTELTGILASSPSGTFTREQANRIGQLVSSLNSAERDQKRIAEAKAREDKKIADAKEREQRQQEREDQQRADAVERKIKKDAEGYRPYIKELKEIESKLEQLKNSDDRIDKVLSTRSTAVQSRIQSASLRVGSDQDKITNSYRKWAKSRNWDFTSPVTHRQRAQKKNDEGDLKALNYELELITAEQANPGSVKLTAEVRKNISRAEGSATTLRALQDRTSNKAEREGLEKQKQELETKPKDPVEAEIAVITQYLADRGIDLGGRDLHEPFNRTWAVAEIVKKEKERDKANNPTPTP